MTLKSLCESALCHEQSEKLEEKQTPPEAGQKPVTFRHKKRQVESLERKKYISESFKNQSVMARLRGRFTAGRHHDQLATIASLVFGLIVCLLLAAIVSSPCVQAVSVEDRVLSRSDLSANYYRAVVNREDGEFEESGAVDDGDTREDIVLGKVQDDQEPYEVPRPKSVSGSGNRSKSELEEQLVANASHKNVRTVASSSHLIIGSENVILPKFGDRISPRKLKKNSQVTVSPAAIGPPLEYDAQGATIREARSGDAAVSPEVVVPTPATASISRAHSNRHSAEDPSSEKRASGLLSKSAQWPTPSNENRVSEADHYLNEVESLPVLLNENQVNNQNVSSAQAHRLEMSTEFFVVPPHSTPLPLRVKSTTRKPNGSMLVLAKDSKRKVQEVSRSAVVTPPTIMLASSPMSGLRKEPWVVPVLVLATLSMFMMAAFEVFVLCKAWRTSPSRRHLFLGQMLLLGLFSCAGLAAILTITPTLLSCATVRFGAGVAFALVFASLLVKCVFLISLNGGVYLPAPYQGLLLLFAVLIQIAVGSQWLLTSPPAVDTISAVSQSITVNRNSSIVLPSSSSIKAGWHTDNGKPIDVNSFGGGPTISLCRTQFPELLLSLIYVVFLILFVAVLAIKSRGIRDNYREATYIGLAIGGSIPIWLAWTLCGLAVAERHRDACLAFGLIATSTTVFLVMFMPKGRQLAAMGKEGLYVEDREERFSSLSRTGSGYSPSFFHFKPIKYGVMGNTNSPSNTNPSGMGGGKGSHNTNATAANNAANHSPSNNNTISIAKHQAVATLGGDH